MSKFCLKKYQEFYEKHGYIPEMFNPYNQTVITDIAPCITTNCGSDCSSATVLIIEKEKGDEVCSKNVYQKL